MTRKRIEEHAFSIEMKSENCIKRMSFLDRENGHVFFEGFLGTLKSVSLVEDVMLEIEGCNGVLRLDITQQELAKCLAANKAKANGGGNQ